MLSTHTPHKPKRTKGNFKTLDSNKSEATTSWVFNHVKVHFNDPSSFAAWKALEIGSE